MTYTKMENRDNYFFYKQTGYHYPPKRYRKMPEELPESLKFAHLNPKVAAYLASKEKQKQEDDLFGDGLGKKSLMPEINQAFQHIKNHLDSSLSNDEDSQRYLFEESKVSAGSILYQLAQIIYFYADIADHIPKSLEYQLLTGYKDMIADVIYVPREWQTYAMKESYYRSLGESHSDDDRYESTEDGRSSRVPHDKSEGSRPKRKSPGKIGLPEIVEDEESGRMTNQTAVKRCESKLSLHSRNPRSRMERVAGSVRSPGMKRGFHDDFMSALTETPSDMRSTAMGNPSYYMSVIQFQLSSKQCEEKGWIVQKGREDEIARETLLEWCVQILQQCMKITKGQQAHERDMGLDKPVQVRYYGDTRKETLLKYRKSPVKQAVNPALKGNKPRIPSMYDDRNEGKHLVFTQHLDGTCVAYYPSGHPAVVASAAGFGRPGYYTVAYDDDPDMKMLACFTPSGKGCCYHNNGVVRFLATQKGGHLADIEGSVTQKWKWPLGNVKITNPVSFQMNSHLIFRCLTQSQMVLHFNCQKENAKFNISPFPGAIECKTGDENEQLLTTFTFSSRAAKELLRLFAPKAKTKVKSKKKDKLKGPLAELQKMMEFQDKLQYDTEAEKELARLQRKARNLVDDWMEHYRIAIGMSSPSLNSMPDAPAARRRYAQSAKLCSGDGHRRATLGLEGTEEAVAKALRAPSAPAGQQKKASVESRNTSPTRSSVSPAVKFDENIKNQNTSATGDSDGDIPTVTLTVVHKLTETALRSHSARNRSKAPSRQFTSMSLPDTLHVNSTTATSTTPYNGMCPSSLRQYLLGTERPQCRCNRYCIPYITDVEYDSYMTKEAPCGQLQIIAVVSSLYPNANSAEDMLDQLYSNMNRNRTRPCVQCRADMYRIFKYDINTAAEMSNHTQPLLLTRHNVVPGMFIIYCDGKLLFCDHIFNGYGNTRRDFKKQIMKSRVDSLHGYSLPKDFRFSPCKGRHGPRSAWGGEIGGAGVDNYGSPGTSLSGTLMSLPRPVSVSSSDTKEPTLEKVKGLDSVTQFISMSLSPTGYHPHTKLTSHLSTRPLSQSVPGTS